MATVSELSQILTWCDTQLRDTMNFWLTKSVDLKHGGYFNCLSYCGEVYDTNKYGWLQGREVWMLSKLYNEVPEYHRADVLEAAIKGGEFLLDHLKVKDQLRCYFAVTESGQPLKLQRKPYTECFYTIGLYELYRATSDTKYQLAAEEMLQQLIHWICVDDSSLGSSMESGAPQVAELGRPMMLLNVLTEVCGTDSKMREKYLEQFQWSVEAILKHHDGQWVHEYILANGKGFPQGFQGRQTTPGHAIEAGWFLLQEALTSDDSKLKDTAIKQFIEMPWQTGWDNQYGGFYYFLDTEGESPVQLEWNMKLWWVHCEALVASLMAYQCTHDSKHWLMFKQAFDYVVEHYPDTEHGEWYGYISREGKINQTFKGGPFKGCFHVPRCLFICGRLLREIQATAGVLATD